jgi:hypothetical protein
MIAILFASNAAVTLGAGNGASPAKSSPGLVKCARI